MWLSVTIPLVKYLRHNHHVSTFRMAITNKEVTTMGNIFVDDMDLVLVGLSPEEPSELLLLRAQGMVTTWQASLCAMGGDLKWDKCCWGTADFVWDSKGHWQYKQLDPSHKLFIKKQPAGMRYCNEMGGPKRSS